ncbi:GAF domain-containing protein [Thalassotalea sp. SU-HH00458]|uniref:GAF domain-containing protein n=1 Tax=Thalassotalea sp. SU-HH00458 TaxID=3127657 RepID=UPI0031065EC6
MPQSAQLSLYLSNPRVSLKDKLHKICRAVKSDVSACDRVSIWLFNDDYSEMTSLICIDENGQKSAGEKLFSKDYGDYFSHIINHQILVASDAREHAISKCFNLGYFDVHNIYSLLDVTFTKDNDTPLGIICCERTGNIAKWKTDEIEILKNISTKASLFISNSY